MSTHSLTTSVVKRFRSPTPDTKSPKTFKTPTKAPSSPIFEMVTTVPRKVWEHMQAVGAKIRYVDGLVCVYCTAGDRAYAVYVEWATSVGEKDPGVQTCLLPQTPRVSVPDTVQESLMITLEANSILDEYHTLLASSFALGHPPIKGYSGITTVPIRFSHASMATHIVAERIANPALGPVTGGIPHTNILRQPVGTYLCTIQQSWKGRIVHIDVLRK